LYLARVALSLGLEATASGKEIVEALGQLAKSPASSRQESIRTMQGEHLAPLIHFGDGGRYFAVFKPLPP
jgi:hypothetical protein